MSIFFRIKNAFLIGYCAYKNPQTIQDSNMKMISDLFGLILKLSNTIKSKYYTNENSQKNICQ